MENYNNNIRYKQYQVKIKLTSTINKHNYRNQIIKKKNKFQTKKQKKRNQIIMNKFNRIKILLK